MIVNLYECRKCGQQYHMVPYEGKGAPHGPNRDCRSTDWVLVEKNTQLGGRS